MLCYTICIRVCLLIYVFGCLSLSLSVFMYVCLLFWLHHHGLTRILYYFICLRVCLSIFFVYLSMCPLVSVFMSVCFFCCFIIFALSKDENKILYSSRVRISRPGFQHPLPPSIQNKMARLKEYIVIAHIIKTFHPNIK
jgi:hypothetical protein